MMEEDSHVGIPKKSEESLAAEYGLKLGDSSVKFGNVIFHGSTELLKQVLEVIHPANGMVVDSWDLSPQDPTLLSNVTEVGWFPSVVREEQAGHVFCILTCQRLRFECSSPSKVHVSCKIVNVRSGLELPEKSRELALHFETQGSPLMMGCIFQKWLLNVLGI